MDIMEVGCASCKFWDIPWDSCERCVYKDYFLATGNRWIDCKSDNLPKLRRYVLVSVEDKVWVASRESVNKKDWLWVSPEGEMVFDKNEVLAWMPLPEYYRG